MSILIFECPLCNLTFPVSIWSDGNSNTWGIENAPLPTLVEAHIESKEGRIQCIHCNTSLYIQIVYAAQIRVLSDRDREGWKIA